MAAEMGGRDFQKTNLLRPPFQMGGQNFQGFWIEGGGRKIFGLWGGEPKFALHIFYGREEFEVHLSKINIQG